MAKFPITGEDLRPKATERGLELLPVVAKSLMSHASLDETRVALTGLGIDGGGEAAWLVAADGSRLIRMPIAGKVPDGVALVIPASEVKAAILRAEAGDVVGRGTQGATLIVIPWCKPTSLKFPPVSQVVPRDTGRGSADSEIPSFNPHYLAEAAKVADSFQRAARLGPALSITLGSMGGGLDPVRYDVNYNRTTIAQIVIMPVRVNPASLPATHVYKPVAPVEYTEERAEAPERPKRERKTRAAKSKPDSETAHIRAEAA